MPRVAVIEYMMSAGGVERVLRGLARAFLAIPEAQEWEVTFVLGRYNSAYHPVEWPTELTGRNVRVEWLGEHSMPSRLLEHLSRGQGIGGLRATRFGGIAAAQLLRRLGPGSWRAYLGHPPDVVARMASQFDLLFFPYPVLLDVPDTDVPIVSSPQDFNFKHFHAEGSPERLMWEGSVRRWLERSERILLTTAAVLEELRVHYPEHAARASVVRLGLDAARRAPAAADLERFRRERGMPRDFLLVAGWVMEHKNQLAVVEALGLLRERGIQLPVVFVGPNTEHLLRPRELGFRDGYAGRVRKALAAAGMVAGRDFHVLGFVGDDDVEKLFHLATVYALPSLYEGFGLPSLEALRAACPTIVSSIPPLEEQNRLLGGTVPTFDPRDPRILADRLAWVLEHQNEARASAARAAERVAEAYDWRNTARAYLAHFADVIEGRPISRP